MNLYSYVVLIFFLFSVSLSAFGLNTVDEKISVNSEDERLRNAFLNSDFTQFKAQINSGANPTEWFNNSRQGWVLCGATESGREQYLQVIIDAGFDVNFRQNNTTSELSTPLFCAITFRNLNAVKLLVKAGADPNQFGF